MLFLCLSFNHLEPLAPTKLNDGNVGLEEGNLLHAVDLTTTANGRKGRLVGSL